MTRRPTPGDQIYHASDLRLCLLLVGFVSTAASAHLQAALTSQSSADQVNKHLLAALSHLDPIETPQLTLRLCTEIIEQVRLGGELDVDELEKLVRQLDLALVGFVVDPDPLRAGITACLAGYVRLILGVDAFEANAAEANFAIAASYLRSTDNYPWKTFNSTLRHEGIEHLGVIPLIPV